MSRHREPPLVDPAHDPRRDVGLATGAAFLGMHKLTLRSRIEAGLLPAFRDGKVYRIRIASLVRYKRNLPDPAS
jgi:excisionase family DNA binding protein